MRDDRDRFVVCVSSFVFFLRSVVFVPSVRRILSSILTRVLSRSLCLLYGQEAHAVSWEPKATVV